jgi:hypothetical protein
MFDKSEYMKKWRAENKARIKAYSKRRWSEYMGEETPEQKEQRKARGAIYRAAHRKEKKTGTGSRRPLSEETKKKLSAKLSGRRHTEESKAKMSKNRKGKGKKSCVQNIRWCPEYYEWRKAVFARDKYLCQECGGGHSTANPIHAHHLIPFAESMEFAFDVDNGITLCKSCHKTKHLGIKKKKDHERWWAKKGED